MPPAHLSLPLAAREGGQELKPNSVLREERDRFVALAFCSADILFEFDADGRVTFAAGATSAIIGASQAQLNGKKFLDLVAPSDRLRVEHLLDRAKSGVRFDRVKLHLAGPGGTIAMALSFYCLPEFGGHYFAALRMSTPAIAREPDHPVRRHRDTGLLEQESFVDAAGQVFDAAAETGEDVRLSLFELADLGKLKSRLDKVSQQDLLGRIGAQLSASSVNGDAAGQFDDEHYGLLHSNDVVLRTLAAEIAECARAMDPEKAGISVEFDSIEIDPGALGREDIARALRYTITAYCNKAGEFSICSLSDGLRALTKETVGRIANFRALVQAGDFSVAYQPICDLATGKIHHFEALARFDATEFTGSPFELITFAEEVGLIGDFDLAMCAKVLKAMQAYGRQGVSYSVAVNLSAFSIGTPAFLQNLNRLLKANNNVRGSVAFEITESANIKDIEQVNEAIQQLRAAGHVVCLDDLGAGAAAFRYLAKLDVDMVKIDGEYVRAATRSAKDKALLRAMAATCRELGVATVAEMIEKMEQVKLVRECDITYGQGFLFGRPSANLREFRSPVRPAGA